MKALIKCSKLDSMLYEITEKLQLIEHGLKVDIGICDLPRITKPDIDLITFRLRTIKNHADNMEKALSALQVIK